MAIPDFQSIMLPLVQFVSDGKEHSIPEIVDAMAEQFKITKEEKAKLLPSGRQPVFRNRVAWVKAHLSKAGLLESPRRGFTKITPRGLQVLAENPTRIDIRYLRRFSEYLEPGPGRKSESAEVSEESIFVGKTPEEIFETAYQNLKDGLAVEILQQIKNNNDKFFEKLVVELLVKMGYGGTLKDAGEAVGKTGDEGVDGIIKEDRLGLDVIYLQAKKWEGTIGRPEIQKFAGALQGQRARKGVFITTSDFSREAKEYASRIENKIVLIDGIQLVDLMIEHNLGVAPVMRYEIKKIDSDYFSDD